MNTRPLGRSDLRVTPLVFGANVFGWTVDQPTTFRLLDHFVEAGLNAVDTAAVYSSWIEFGCKGGRSRDVLIEDVAQIDVLARVAMLARLVRQVRNGAAPRVSENGAEGARFTTKGVRSHRARQGVSAADFGKLVGVTGHTVYKWEHGAAKPRKRQLAALASLRAVGKREAATRLEKLVAKPAKRKRSKK